jgi:hypothetical protein
VTAAAAAGPSGGVLGDINWDKFIDDACDFPRLREHVYKHGRVPRAGHNRARWPEVAWNAYRAHVGICGRRGPWRVDMVEEKPDTPSQWVAEAEGMPFRPGWYTALIHNTRGLIMSDVPGEIAGALPFLDRVQLDCRRATARRSAGPSVLISGLGLGIIPAWLLARTSVGRIDIIEIDPDVIELVARDVTAREAWADDPRLHVHLGDALTWTPRAGGCQLHGDCAIPTSWTGAWHDLWDYISSENLPSMHRLHRRFGHRAGWQMSWERPECEARARRGPPPPITFCALQEAMGTDHE